MKKSAIVFFIFILLPGCFNSIQNCLFAQSPTTQGKEFYFSFMQNGYRTCNGGPGNEHLNCIISAKRACSGTIRNPNTGWSTNFTVAANGIATISIPESESYSTNSEIVENLGLIVTATDTISLFIANEATNSFDASNVLPLEALAEKYVIQSFTSSIVNISGSQCNDNIRSAFIIIATENNTVIDITPSCYTKNGKSANVTFAITLNKGQSYQVMSYDRGTSGDLSGSLVEARDCKKIAVFNGNILTGVPETMDNGFDHIFEQAMPVIYWGNKFAITASEARKGDFIRVTALNNNTQIKVNNSLQTTINEGKTYEFLLSNSSCYVETTGPCVVYLYQTTGGYDNSVDGDPSMVWITPVEQQVKEITFGTFTATGTIRSHYVNIVTSTSEIHSMTLNGSSISTQFQPLTGNPDLSFTRITIPHGTHTLKSDTGFTAFVYGFGNVRGYAYSVGSSAINLNGIVYVNETDILSASTNNGKHYCINTLITFTASIYSEYESITWNFGDGTVIQAGDSISHTYTRYGTFLVKMIVKYKSQGCQGSMSDTIEGYIQIPYLKRTFYETICKGDSYNKYDFNLSSDSLDYTGTKTFSKTLKSIYGCDSIVDLHLTVNPVYHFVDTMLVCINSEKKWHNKKLPTSTLGSHIIFDSLKTENSGCDSIHRLFLIVTDRIEIEATSNDTLFCSGDTLKLNIVNKNTSFDNIRWNGPDNFSSSLPNPKFVVQSTSNTGLYVVDADSIEGCFIIPDTLEITVLDPITINLTDTSVICKSNIIYSNCSGADYFLWSTGDITENIVVSTSGFHWLKASNQRCSVIDSIFIVELNSFDFQIQKSGNLCNEDDMVLFVALPEVDYLWDTKETTPSITINSSGEYSVTVSLEECIVTKTISVFCDCHLWIPNTFTPNKDGTNETFIPVPQEELNSFSMSIFDRWGNLIYKTNSYIPWDGKTVDGEYVAAGTYTYSISFSCVNNPDKKLKKQGRISLIR
jgi:gliding motility-associated-like protein